MREQIPEQIEMSPDEIESLTERVKSRSLRDGDYELIEAMAQTLLFLRQVIEQKEVSIRRLLRLLFGASTESSKNIAGTSDKKSPSRKKSKRKAKKGHGRNGAERYGAARRVWVSHESLKSGARCMLCLKGKVYRMADPSVVIRIVGKAPIDATVYELERLRCNLCGEVFTAKLPEEAGDQKYDFSAGAIIALLKYGSGFPFYRLEKLQENLGIPLPASTQWDVVEKTADRIHPVFEELIRQAAQGKVIQNDDTTMKILSLVKEIRDGGDDSSRRGIFTTSLLSHLENQKIALFFTGRDQAGENLDEVLQRRATHLDAPIQMCDALSRNLPKELETIVSHCLVHARRHFVDVLENFPEECRYVIDMLGTVYHHESMIKDENMTPEQRLEFHQIHSAPVMEELKGWCTEQLEQRKVEPNSGLGNAIRYLLKHWDKFTLFLRVPDAPLDNNLCEQALKKAILHRKNGLFYRTEHGAYIGDVFMSLIHTCSLNGVNPFEYLKTLQEHSSQVFKDPSKWLPWNYQSNLSKPSPGG